MASTRTKNGSTNANAAFNQVKELNEQFLAATREAGNLYLDTYERAVDRTIELERKFAGLSKQQWVKELVETQTDLARDVASSYTNAARALLK